MSLGVLWGTTSFGSDIAFELEQGRPNCPLVDFPHEYTFPFTEAATVNVPPQLTYSNLKKALLHKVIREDDSLITFHYP